MKYLFITLMLSLSASTLASPQIYPSNVEFMGAGNLSTKVTLFGTTEKTDVELVYVQDITQSESLDIKLGSFVLNPKRDLIVPVNLYIIKPKTFWICVKSYDGPLPIRNCTTFKPKG